MSKFIITLRQSGHGAPTNGALAYGSEGNESELAQSTALTLLTHGYNVDGASGHSSLDLFVNTLHLDAGTNYALVLWPGDVPWNGFASKVSFPAKLKTAKRSAEKLADYLSNTVKLRKDCSLSFVSHSLGARVVLESIRQLRQKNYKNIRHVCLMAAAVENTALQKEYSDIPGAAKNIGVLASKHDRVLQVLFPVGTLAAKFLRWPGGVPKALGYSGPRDPAPQTATSLIIPDNRNAGHGHYLPCILGAPDSIRTENWCRAARFTNDVLQDQGNPQYICP